MGTEPPNPSNDKRLATEALLMLGASSAFNEDVFWVWWTEDGKKRVFFDTSNFVALEDFPEGRCVCEVADYSKKDGSGSGTKWMDWRMSWKWREDELITAEQQKKQAFQRSPQPSREELANSAKTLKKT